MFKRPIIIPLIFLIIGIIIVDSFIPVFFVNDHYSVHFDKAISFRYLITDNYKPKTNWNTYQAKVIEYFDRYIKAQRICFVNTYNLKIIILSYFNKNKEISAENL